MNFMRNFNRLSNLTGKWQTRNISQTTVKYSANKNLIIEPLTEREVIRVKGDEVVPFIQGLITNDIKHLHPSSNKAIYAMFLNKAGRVLYDTIIYSTTEANKILIECDKNVANDLKRHLRLYRVRRNIDIDSMDDELKVWQIFNSNPGESKENLIQLANVTDITITTDPRLKDLGCRLLVNSDKTSNDLTNVFALQEGQMTSSTNDNNFRLNRYRLGIAEGVIDMPPGKCFPLEANCDILNGVSFHKGCYIGQELTARVHHTGMIRKRHMPVRLMAPLASDISPLTVLNESGANCGTILGSIADKALGLLRIENVLKAKELLVNGSPCETEKPLWWPQDLNAKVSLRKDI